MKRERENALTFRTVIFHQKERICAGGMGKRNGERKKGMILKEPVRNTFLWGHMRKKEGVGASMYIEEYTRVLK